LEQIFIPEKLRLFNSLYNKELKTSTGILSKNHQGFKTSSVIRVLPVFRFLYGVENAKIHIITTYFRKKRLNGSNRPLSSG
jgi:hypothetical protein